jgi:hypothetical protein
VKRLEDIPKITPFKVPEGYFESLPTRIQARTQPQEMVSWLPNLGMTLKIAIPVFLIALVSIVIWSNSIEPKDTLAGLDSVSTEQLLAYLESDEITIDEILENASFSSANINTFYPAQEELSPEALEKIAQEYDVNF